MTSLRWLCSLLAVCALGLTSARAEEKPHPKLTPPPQEDHVKLEDKHPEGEKPKPPDPILIEAPGVKGALTVEYPFLVKEYFLPSLSHLVGRKVKGEQSDLVEMVFENTGEAAVTLTAKAQLQGFSEWAKDTVTVKPGEKKSINLTPVFKGDLSTLAEQQPGAIEWELLTSDGKALATKTLKITLASRNDMLITENLDDFMAVFVTPNDPVVDEVLSAARDAQLIEAFDGYQSKDPQQVAKQAQAVFDVLSKLGLHYRSATATYLDTKDISAQKVYFPRESVVGTGANCIDGSVLIAACFEKIELKPYLVFVPGHAFVAVALDDAETDFLCIETTMMGNAKEDVSSFEDAVKSGKDTFKDALEKKEVAVVDIAKARKNGITPYPYHLKLTTKDADLKKRLGLE